MTAVIVFFAFVLLLGLPWIFLGNDYFLYQYFAPKREAVRRQVFEETRSFQQGVIQELSNMHREYVLADSTHQAVLRQLILRRSLELPEDRLPADLRAFIAQLRREE